MPDLLEFEEPIGELLKEIEALAALAPGEERDREIARLEGRVNVMRADLYRNLTPWQRVQVARHPSRPTTLDYVESLFTEFVELHGDRRFADDHAIVTGTALYKGRPILVVGHQKGSDTKQKIYRNFGYARPDGYRKAMRTMEMAQKFKRPIICFVDTPAAYPASNPKSAASPRRSRSTCARWRCSKCRSSSWCTAKAAAAARSVLRSATAS